MNRYSAMRDTANDPYIPPISAIEMPKPLYPERINSVPQIIQLPANQSFAISLPAVSEEVKAAAQQRMIEEKAAPPTSPSMIAVAPPHVAATNAAPISKGFIAPAPLILAAPAIAITAPTSPVPLVAKAPNTAITQATPQVAVHAQRPLIPAVVIAEAPATSPVPLISKAPDAAIAQAALQVATIAKNPPTELSDQTRAILSSVPGNLDKTTVAPPTTVSINRVSPEIKDLIGDKAKEESYEAVGLSIKVRRPGLDTNHELNRAYTSLMGGDSEAAIETYKNILSTNSSNQDALFGLAATYHRLNNFDKARPLYGALLKINPQHREGLNNFLVLVSDESPQDALPELIRLESRNPDFSPIPAQIAIVLDKLGFKDEARDKMLRAIDLSPDNMTYKYNLAIMLDRQGRVADASALYRMLIESSLHGQKIPASADAMQRRLNYLSVSDNKLTTSIPATAVN